MRNVSLLPIEIKLNRKAARRWNAVIVSLLAAVLVLLVVYTTMSVYMLMPNAELNAVRQERTDVRNNIEKLRPYEDKLNDVKAVQGLVKEAMGVNPQWDGLLKKIYNRMPDSIWLSDFTVNYKDPSGEFDMRGSAKSHNDVAAWLTDLKAVSGIGDIQCQYSAENKSAADDTVQFEIKAVILPGEGYQPAVEGGLVP